MHISDYLENNNLSQAEFGRVIGVSQAAIERYVNDKRIPEPQVMQKIFDATSGQVTANDFYDLPAKPNGKHNGGDHP